MKEPKSIDFDPRAKDDRVGSLDHIRNHLSDLNAILPNNGIQQLWEIPVETPEIVVEVEV